MTSRRALHYVFKIGNRAETTKFYRDVLGMKILRHEEFEEGCKAACNGPYDGKWSKSMVGYGCEDDHFVMELTYNYGLGSYTLGNAFQGIKVESKEVLENATKVGWMIEEEGDQKVLRAPDGYKFYITPSKSTESRVLGVALSCVDLEKSVAFWKDKCGMQLKHMTPNARAVLEYDSSQAHLELIQVDGPVNHATAGGRIAFSCPSNELAGIEKTMKESGETILTPLVSLDTPGKATVQVDGHEICFVGDEAFRELSQIDPEADQLLNEAMTADKSDEWFAKKGLTKAKAS